MLSIDDRPARAFRSTDSRWVPWDVFLDQQGSEQSRRPRGYSGISDFRPEPVSRITVVWSGVMTPLCRRRVWPVAASALVGSTKKPRWARALRAVTNSSSVTATVPPRLSRSARNICAVRNGRAMAALSAKVGKTGRVPPPSPRTRLSRLPQSSWAATTDSTGRHGRPRPSDQSAESGPQSGAIFRTIIGATH